MATDAKVEPGTDLRAWAAAKAKEIIASSANFPGGEGVESAPSGPFSPEEQERRSKQVRDLFERLSNIGTEEEQRESLEILMKAMAETRRTEGRPF